ncbi:hypothetical protein ACJX0J_036138 [Zea mays]
MQAYRFLEPAVPEILHMDLFFSTFTAHSHIFTFILDLALKTYYAVPSFQGMALEFTNKLRYLDCQSKETSTSRYPFPLAKKNRHDRTLKNAKPKNISISRDEAVQGYYPDIDENEEDLVQKMIEWGMLLPSFSASLGVAVFLLVKKLK